MIFTQTNLITDLTIHKISGEVHTDTFLKSMRMLKEHVTSRVLWDLRDVYSLGAIQPTKLENFSIYILDMPIVADGKAAIVFATKVDFEIGQQFETFAKVHKPPFKIALFQSLDEARSWLDETLPVA